MSNKKLTYLIKNSKNIYFDIFPLKMSKNDPNVLKKKKVKIEVFAKKTDFKSPNFQHNPKHTVVNKDKTLQSSHFYDTCKFT